MHCKKHLRITEAVAAVPPVVYNSKWAETEIVVRVLEKPYPWYSVDPRGTSTNWGWFVLIIPVYSGQGGWELSYSFYDRNALKRHTHTKLRRNDSPGY